MNCPNCGRSLIVPDAVMWDWQTAPFVCSNCGHGYWASELSPVAAQSFDKANRYFPHSVRLLAKQEREAAKQIGHGVTSKVYKYMTKRQVEMFKQSGKKVGP